MSPVLGMPRHLRIGGESGTAESSQLGSELSSVQAFIIVFRFAKERRNATFADRL